MKTLIIALFLSGALYAQNPGPVYPVTTSPDGQACGRNILDILGPNGVLYTCQNGIMHSTGSTTAFAPVSNAGTDVVCALHADAGLGCINQVVDGTTTTAFSTTTTIPANMLTTNVTVPANLSLGVLGSATAAQLILSIKLGSTTIYTGGQNVSANSANTAIQLSCQISAGAAASAATPLVTVCTGTSSGVFRNQLITSTTKSIPVDTTIAQVLSVAVIYGANTAGNAVWLYSISPGSGGAVGPAGAPGVLATNTEGTSNIVMVGSADCPSAHTITTGAWTYTPLAIPPTANCGVSIQNNSSSAGTIVTGGVTIINGQTANGTIPACLSAKDGCPVWVLRANGSAGWDLSVASSATSVAVTDSIWFSGAYFNQSLTIPGWSAGVNTSGSAFSPSKYGTMNYSLGTARASYLNYTLPSTWTGTITFKIWSTLAFSSSGTGAYYLGIYTSCVTMGTTNAYDGLTYNTVQSINHTFASTNYKTGALDSFTLTTTGCSAGSNLNIEILRDNSIFPLDVAVDDIQVMGVQLLVSHT